MLDQCLRVAPNNRWAVRRSNKAHAPCDLDPKQAYERKASVMNVTWRHLPCVNVMPAGFKEQGGECLWLGYAPLQIYPPPMFDMGDTPRLCPIAYPVPYLIHWVCFYLGYPRLSLKQMRDSIAAPPGEFV